MRKTTLAIIVLLLALTTPSAVLAQRQKSVRFQNIQIDLWPEFDRPAMLVVFRAQLASDVDLPVDVTFRIPAEVGQPHAVAVRDTGGAALNADYELQVLDEWAYINLTTSYPEIQIEYYDTNITREDNVRSFTFNWPADYAADNVVMLVQQPIGATNITTMPRLTEITRDANNLIYLQGEIGAVSEGETFSMTVTYEKDTEDLTTNFIGLDSSAPVTTETPGRMSVDSALPYAMAILGVIVIFIAGFWYWSTGKQTVPSRKRAAKNIQRKKKRVVEPEMHDHNPYEQSTFCHHCGKRAVAGDKFCRSCGAKLRL
jgi:hypothetical protein